MTNDNSDGILDIFDKVVKTDPKSNSIKCNSTILTYGELNILVNKIANNLSLKLKKICDKKNINNTIPILLDKSHFTVASIIAIWKLGLSCVIINKLINKDNFEFVINTIKPIIIIDSDFIAELDNLDKAFENPINKDKYIGINDLALICFTSGTTGQAKSVMIDYKQISIACKNIEEEFIKYLPKSLTLALTPSFSSIVGILNTFGLIFAKGCLHIISDEKVTDLVYLTEYIKYNKIAGAFFPPYLAIKFLNHGNGILDCLFVGTDKVSNLYSSKTTIINIYGSTETIGFSSFFVIDKLYINTPIGKPTDNTKIYILDDNLKKVKRGEIGEIYISNSLSLGYLNNEKLTKKKFIANPYSTSNDDRVLYKTEDLGYYNENNDIVYHSRKDFIYYFNFNE
ncbi:MAG: AMP-binding protein [Methanobrevibacter sp.]|nr:AMP-binding protein [Candidatus Methanovirga procula]